MNLVGVPYLPRPKILEPWNTRPRHPKSDLFWHVGQTLGANRGNKHASLMNAADLRVSGIPSSTLQSVQVKDSQKGLLATVLTPESRAQKRERLLCRASGYKLIRQNGSEAFIKPAASPHTSRVPLQINPA